jgi:hypothetical protein
MTTLAMVHGDTPSFDVVVVHPVTQDPVDLTGATITMRAVTAYGATSFAFEVSTTSGDIELIPGQTNRALITLPTSATSPLPNEFTRLFFDVVVALGTDVWTTDSGMLIVRPKVAVATP